MIDGQLSPQAVQAVLTRLPQLTAAEASKGTIPAGLADTTADVLQILLAIPLQQQGASALQDLFSSYLPAAVAAAQRRVTAGGRFSPSAADPIGLGVRGGWPRVAPAGPGGAGSVLPGTGKALWPAVEAGAGGSGLSADPALRPSFGYGGSRSFFDPYQNPVGGPADIPAPQGRISGAQPMGVAGSGVSVSSSELSQYFSSSLYPQNADTFVISEWVSTGSNPMLLLQQLASAKRLYQDVVLPCARYYKHIVYGSEDYPVRLAQILYGIVSAQTIRGTLRAGPKSRHLLGQAVNFSIQGIEDVRVVDDITAGHIKVNVGTYGATTGVYASLPFELDGQLITRLLLHRDPDVPGAIGYQFT